MSCIVGYIDRINKKTYIGADSCASTGESKQTLSKAFKIFKPKTNPNFLIGVVGSLRALQLVKYFLKFHREDFLIDEKIEFNEEYISIEIVPELQEIFKKHKYGDEGKDLGWSVIMIAYKDRLFTIEDNYGVVPHPISKAIGSGTYHADGALFALNKSDSYEYEVEKILIALRASSELSRGVKGPFYIMNTADSDCLEYDY